jgi:hypothetical protein
MHTMGSFFFFGGGGAEILSWLLTYLITYSIEQRPFWEANKSSVSQGIPRILWNKKVLYIMLTIYVHQYRGEEYM